MKYTDENKAFVKAGTKEQPKARPDLLSSSLPSGLLPGAAAGADGIETGGEGEFSADPSGLPPADVALDDISIIAAIVIGRNEGDRLKKCLFGLRESGVGLIIYVDSGSTDGSVQFARDLGVHVVTLDMERPFTAARARNAGARAVRKHAARIQYLQFIDGDCEMIDGWFEEGLRFLVSHPKYAVVCGRVKERYPDRSVYNQLCDMEWDIGAGDVSACGGIALYDRSAFEMVGGFRDDLIAGEEPELCFRLRQNSLKIRRVVRDMCWHDAAMTRFSQWWLRMRRGGFAYGRGYLLHGFSPDAYNRREVMRILFWGGLLPVILGLSIFLTPGFLGLLWLYPLQMARIAIMGQGLTSKRWVRAFFLMIGKFAEFIGVIESLWGAVAGKERSLIEYKNTDNSR